MGSPAGQPVYGVFPSSAQDRCPLRDGRASDGLVLIENLVSDHLADRECGGGGGGGGVAHVEHPGALDEEEVVHQVPSRKTAWARMPDG